MLLLSRNILGKSGGEISRKKNKGVLDRHWTKHMVLITISSTLKFQFTENHEFEKNDYSVIGQTKNRRPGVYFDAQCVSAHSCRAKAP